MHCICVGTFLTSDDSHYMYCKPNEKVSIVNRVTSLNSLHPTVLNAFTAKPYKGILWHRDNKKENKTLFNFFLNDDFIYCSSFVLFLIELKQYILKLNLKLHIVIYCFSPKFEKIFSSRVHC